MYCLDSIYGNSAGSCEPFTTSNHLTNNHLACARKKRASKDIY